MKIFNGEKRDITVITDVGSVVIPAQETREIEVPEDAEFGQPEFYVKEEGNWYIKMEGCASGADAEIYDADTE
jgi:hypothetical protein